MYDELNYEKALKKAKDQNQVVKGRFIFEVGLLLRSQVRLFLKESQFKGLSFKFEEVKSFLSSTFLVKGDVEDTKLIFNYLKKFE